jgi:hypothetical protein
MDRPLFHFDDGNTDVIGRRIVATFILAITINEATGRGSNPYPCMTTCAFVQPERICWDLSSFTRALSSSQFSYQKPPKPGLPRHIKLNRNVLAIAFAVLIYIPGS